MNIDEMEAGPELNVLVAEKVMGYDWIYDVDWIHRSVSRHGYIGRIRPKGFPLCVASGQHAGVYLRDYSGDIAAAMKAVDRIIEGGKYESFDLQWAHSDAHIKSKSGDDGPWCAVFTPLDDGVWSVGRGDTRALAICRAILKAVQGQEEPVAT